MIKKMIKTLKNLLGITNKESEAIIEALKNPHIAHKLEKEIYMGIKVFKRDQAGEQLTPNFKAGEFFCKCGKCEDQHIHMGHVQKLQEFRESLGKPITITSAYRCIVHNKNVGGSPRSQHVAGTATDIVVRGMTPSEVADKCEHFDGLGRYNTFTHLDSRGVKARWDFTKN